MSQSWIAEAVNVSAKVCLGLGLLCSGVFVAAQVDRQIVGNAAIDSFQRAREAALADAPDQSLWSDSRRAGYLTSLRSELGSPPGLLRVPAIGLVVPIFEGTGERILNRGVGWIQGTAELGAPGNTGLAGHRDGFFRGLKDLEIGDSIEVQTLEGSVRYRITELLIVDPTDVYVLDPTPVPSVTLVTCYPFYFVGHAPQRFIVRGVADKSST